MAGRAPVIPRKSKAQPLAPEERIRRARAMYAGQTMKAPCDPDDWLDLEEEAPEAPEPDPKVPGKKRK